MSIIVLIDVSTKNCINKQLCSLIGWFHEVFSSGSASSSVSSDKSSSVESNVKDLKDVHMALNYWCHPPDGISFEKPYKSDFWPIDWRRRGGRLT